MFRTAVRTTVVLVLLAASAHAQSHDEKVYLDVRRAVLGYPNFTIFDTLSAAADAGVVTLTGRVTMPFKRTDLEKVVAGLPGVRAVRNQIEVLSASPSDEDLRRRVAKAIYGNASFWDDAAMANPPIHIIVDGGHVTLTGVVQNDAERTLAESLTIQFGAPSISNELRTSAEVAKSPFAVF